MYLIKFHLDELLLYLIFFWQLRVVARDGGTPPRTDTTVATVNVNRNLNKPRFEPSRYQATILETTTIGEVVATVSADDQDRRVLFHA